MDILSHVHLIIQKWITSTNIASKKVWSDVCTSYQANIIPGVGGHLAQHSPGGLKEFSQRGRTQSSTAQWNFPLMHVLLNNEHSESISVKCKTNMVSSNIIFKVLPRLTRSLSVSCTMRNFGSIFEGTHGFRTTKCMFVNNTTSQAPAEWDDNRQQ